MTEYQVKSGDDVSYIFLSKRFTDEGAKEHLVNQGYGKDIEVTQYFNGSHGEY